MKIVRNTYFFLHNKAVFCKNIWSCQKKAVPLQPISKRDQVFLAQLVEQLTLNQWVQGSSPWEDTKGYPKGYPFFCVPMRTRILGERCLFCFYGIILAYLKKIL